MMADQRYHPEAWRREAEASLRRSRERREREANRIIPSKQRLAHAILGGLGALLFIVGTWAFFLLLEGLT